MQGTRYVVIFLTFMLLSPSDVRMVESTCLKNDTAVSLNSFLSFESKQKIIFITNTTYD